MYCLVYGQMSHWGVTVITNLVTAVPVLGQAIAEFIYQFNSLKTIGEISPHARKNKIIIPEKYFLNIPKSFLSMFVGIIDGDGYIHTGNSGKGFIKINLVLSLNIRDKSLLEYIKSILKIGDITYYPKSKTPTTCKYIINKTDLQEILFPLLIYHNINFLTNTRIKQYNKARYIMENNISKYENINENNIKNYINLPKTPEDYIKLDYFNNWIIGFTISDGSFHSKKNNDFCFNIKQRIHDILLNAIKLVFNTTVSIYNEKNKYQQLIMTSKKDIQTVINFYSYSGNHPLIGYKLLQYQKWLENLKISKRYKDLKF